MGVKEILPMPEWSPFFKLTEKQLNWILDSLVSEIGFPNPGYSFYLFGHGGLSKGEINAHRNDKKLQVHWSGTSLPWFMLPLRFIPNEAILVRIKEPRTLRQYFYDVGNGTMISVLHIEDKVVENILQNQSFRSVFSIGKFIPPTEGYFEVEVDLDSDESTGKFPLSFRTSLEFQNRLKEAFQRVIEE